MNTHEVKKDTLSYERHDAEYRATDALDPAWHAKNFESQGFYNQYEVLGFKTIVESQSSVRDLHIDFGCGAGWLLTRTAPLFKKVIGIDPSAAALRSARIVIKDLQNVELVEKDMVEALDSMTLTEPVFATTCTVLSHIENDWVIEFLKRINGLPRGSILFFGEPFDKNVERTLWHIRSREWWAAQLPHWQLFFNDHAPFGYRYGISGICVGKENVMSTYPQSPLERILWNLEGLYHRVRAYSSDLRKRIVGTAK